MDKEIIVDNVNVAECRYFDNAMCQAEKRADGNTITECFGFICYYKQLKRLQSENERLKEENKKLKYFLNKIRDDELYSMDVEWDEYITKCGCTEYSNIITFVELALGERNE